jgi:hypothetical protein
VEGVNVVGGGEVHRNKDLDTSHQASATCDQTEERGWGIAEWNVSSSSGYINLIFGQCADEYWTQSRKVPGTLIAPTGQIALLQPRDRPASRKYRVPTPRLFSLQ